VEYLKELLVRADLGGWQSWSTLYRVLVVVGGLLAAYWLLRVAVPAVLRILRPFILAAIVLAAIWAMFPAETCSLEFLARLPTLCGR
jgi:hypothetical protein